MSQRVLLTATTKKKRWALQDERQLKAITTPIASAFKRLSEKDDQASRVLTAAFLYRWLTRSQFRSGLADARLEALRQEFLQVATTGVAGKVIPAGEMASETDYLKGSLLQVTQADLSELRLLSTMPAQPIDPGHTGPLGPLTMSKVISGITVRYGVKAGLLIGAL